MVTGFDIYFNCHTGVFNCNLIMHCVILVYLFYRASIVQKKIIYFQDEGSLTKRMCEPGKSIFIAFKSSFSEHTL